MRNVRQVLEELEVSWVERYSDYAVPCPFHNETKPSLFVNKEEGFFHCFGCGRKGKFESLIAKYLNIDILTAYEYLYLGKSFNKVEYKKKIIKVDFKDMFKLYAMNNSIANDYLKSRGLINYEKYRCGFDMSQNRLTIPVIVNNELVGFDSRSLIDNTYKALFFKKSNYFYGMDWLQKKEKMVFLVESAISVMYLKENLKINNALAFMGRVISENRLKYLAYLLQNGIETLYVWGDNDKAGHALDKAIYRAFPKHTKILISAKDPDEVKSLQEVREVRRLHG